MQLLELLVITSVADDVLVDGVGGLTDLQADGYRVLGEGMDQIFDAGIEGRREEERLAFG